MPASLVEQVGLFSGEGGASLFSRASLFSTAGGASIFSGAGPASLVGPDGSSHFSGEGMASLRYYNTIRCIQDTYLHYVLLVPEGHVLEGIHYVLLVPGGHEWEGLQSDVVLRVTALILYLNTQWSD